MKYAWGRHEGVVCSVLLLGGTIGWLLFASQAVAQGEPMFVPASETVLVQESLLWLLSGALLGAAALLWGIQFRRPQRSVFTEPFFQQCFVQAPVAMAILDEQVRLQQINDAFMQRFFTPGSHWQNSSLTQLLVPQDSDLQVLISACRLEQPWRQRLALMDAQGVPVWTLATLSLHAGEQRRYLLVLDDISDAIQKEHELTLAQEKYHTFFDWIPEGAMLVDPETLLPTEFNRPAYEQLGFTAEEFAALPINHYLLSNDSDSLPQIIAQVVRRGSGEFEVFYRHWDGELRNLFVYCRYLQFENRPALFFCYRDITQLQKLSTRLELATRAAGIGVWEWDMVTDHISWDETLSNLYGRDPDYSGNLFELWQQRLHPEDRERTMMAFNAGVEQASHFSIAFRILLPDGELRYIDMATAVIRNYEGQPIRILGVNWDSTEHRVAAQSLQLAKREAESENSAKSDFLASMSHEIRTPMNAIIGLTQLLRDTQLDSQQHDLLDKVYGSCRTLLSLLNDILDYSKIESGYMELELAEFDFASLLEPLASLFAAQAERKGVKLYFNVGATVPRRLRGDSLRLGQVLTNLMSNALKFTENGEVECQIEVREQTAGVVKLQFTLRDTGLGISREARDKLFNAFTQLDSSTTRKYGGTGLGLAISQHLVQLMGGEITIQGEPGVGSEFSFVCEFPVLDNAPATEVKIGGRLLLLESCELSSVVLHNILQSVAIDVERIADEAEQMKRLCSGSLSDYRYILIGENGGAKHNELLLEALLQRDAASTPMLLMSSPELYERALAVRGDNRQLRLLPRPFLTSTLLKALQNSGDQQPPWQQTEMQKMIEQLRGCRVLLAEDHVLNRQVVEALLQQWGLYVDVAENGQQAVQLASHITGYDLLLMDMYMPVMNGLEATRLIREFNPQIPIVAMTAAATREDREQCLAAGMNDYLSKPVDPGSLLAKLARWIRVEESSTEEVLLPAKGLEEVNLQDGLQRVGGKEHVFRHVLLSFCEHYQIEVLDLASRLVKSTVVAQEDWLHKFKSSVGAIGATKLYPTVDKLYAQTRQGMAINTAQAAFLENRLQKLIAAAQDYLARVAAPEVLVTKSPQELFAELGKRLARNELVENDLIAQLQLLAGDEEDSNKIESLCRALRRFDYAQAMQIYQQLTRLSISE